MDKVVYFHSRRQLKIAYFVFSDDNRLLYRDSITIEYLNIYIIYIYIDEKIELDENIYIYIISLFLKLVNLL